MGKYDDLLDLPRPVSRRHPPMSNANRAKQFMPFAALRGYDQVIAEKELRFEPRSVLSEEDGAALDAALRRLAEALARGERPRVALEAFEPREPGEELGRFRTHRGRLEKLDSQAAALRVDGRWFAFEDITAIGREDEI